MWSSCADDRFSSRFQRCVGFNFNSPQWGKKADDVVGKWFLGLLYKKNTKKPAIHSLQATDETFLVFHPSTRLARERLQVGINKNVYVTSLKRRQAYGSISSTRSSSHKHSEVWKPGYGVQIIMLPWTLIPHTHSETTGWRITYPCVPFDVSLLLVDGVSIPVVRPLSLTSLVFVHMCLCFMWMSFTVFPFHSSQLTNEIPE